MKRRKTRSRTLAVFVCLLLAAQAVAAAAATITLSPVRDNTVYGDLPANSNGKGDGVYAGRTSSGGLRRGLIAFDLSGIPAGATVNSASLTLRMSQTASGTQTVGLHRLNADWGEGMSAGAGSGAPATSGDATWLRRFYDTVSWTTPGGDFAGAAGATQSVGAVGSYTWSGSGLTADVQSWHANPSGNFGWIVIGSEGSSLTTKKFDSREGAVPPVLTVEYTPALPATSGWGLALLALALFGSAVRFLRRRPTRTARQYVCAFPFLRIRQVQGCCGTAAFRRSSGEAGNGLENITLGSMATSPQRYVR